MPTMPCALVNVLFATAVQIMPSINFPKGKKYNVNGKGFYLFFSLLRRKYPELKLLKELYDIIIICNRTLNYIIDKNGSLEDAIPENIWKIYD